MSTPELDLHIANFKLEVLQEIIHILPENDDPEDTLKFIMSRIFSLIEMEGATLLLPNENRDKLVFVEVRGSKEKALTGMEISAESGIAGSVFQSGKSQLINNTEKSEDFLKAVDETTGYTTRSVIAVPVIASGKVMGVLEGVNLDLQEIKSPVELKGLFQSLGDIIAIVLRYKNLTA